VFNLFFQASLNESNSVKTVSVGSFTKPDDEAVA